MPGKRRIILEEDMGDDGEEFMKGVMQAGFEKQEDRVYEEQRPSVRKSRKKKKTSEGGSQVENPFASGLSVFGDGLSVFGRALRRFLVWLRKENEGHWASVVVQVGLGFLLGWIYAYFTLL
jgi:hypothetical protein